ncbi:MAG: GAF domain-containing protein [Candidatus Promineifilaceae bacterium]
MKKESTSRTTRFGSVRTHLLIGFGILSLLLLLLLVASLFSFRAIRGDIDEMSSEMGSQIFSEAGAGDLSEETAASLKESSDRVDGMVGRYEAIVILLALFTLLTCLAIAVYFAIYLLRPVELLNKTAKELSQGNLEITVPDYGFDEFNEIGRSLEGIAAQLRDSVGTLEEMLAERTRALVTTFQVSRRLSTILNKEQLASEVVEQVRLAFNYYHVHIYLLDEKGQYLVLVGGTGSAGRAMLAAGHKLDRNLGLVGKAVKTGEVILAADVTEDPAWLPNPLLPDTKSEVAVPIVLGNEVVGILDVQQDETGGLGDTDAALLQSIANQVAIALQNAQLYDEAQRSAYHAALVNAINQRIQQASSVEDVMQVAARELGQALGVPKTTVQLGNVDRTPRPDEKQL